MIMCAIFAKEGMFDPEAIPPGRDQQKAPECIVCGCTDSKACSGGCEWIMVDYEAGIGICSNPECNTSANLLKLEEQLKEIQNKK